jgi:glucose-6-phosphate-specific signal transduction histidine kinase
VKATDIGRLDPAIEAASTSLPRPQRTPSSTRAHQVEITLARTPQALHLTITDDGAGGAAISGGTGLQGLHDRADAVGGHITLISPAGRPTVLTAHLPILGALTER